MHTLFEPGERGFLLTDIGRLIHKAFEQRAEALGYTRAHWRILAYLQQEPGMMQAVLAERLEVEPITLSRHLDRMEADRLVERRGDPRDRRVKRVYLLPEAEMQLAELRKVRNEIVEAIFTEVSEDDVAHIKKVLTTVRRNLMDKVK